MIQLRVVTNIVTFFVSGTVSHGNFEFILPVFECPIFIDTVQLYKLQEDSYKALRPVQILQLNVDSLYPITVYIPRSQGFSLN